MYTRQHHLVRKRKRALFFICRSSEIMRYSSAVDESGKMSHCQLERIATKATVARNTRRGNLDSVAADPEQLSCCSPSLKMRGTAVLQTSAGCSKISLQGSVAVGALGLEEQFLCKGTPLKRTLADPSANNVHTASLHPNRKGACMILRLLWLAFLRSKAHLPPAAPAGASEVRDNRLSPTSHPILEVLPGGPEFPCAANLATKLLRPTPPIDPREMALILLDLLDLILPPVKDLLCASEFSS